MTDEPIICPRCAARLRLRPDLSPEQAVTFTCPRCLAAVPSPADVRVTTPAASAAPESPRIAAAHCPGCSAVVEPGWANCPHCGERLRHEVRRPRPGGLDRDVRLDQRGVGFGTILLAVLGGLTLLSMLSGVGTASVASTPDVAVMVCLLYFLLPLLLLLGIFAFYLYRYPQDKRLVGRAVVRTLAVVGFLTALWVAFLIVFIAVCIASGTKL